MKKKESTDLNQTIDRIDKDVLTMDGPSSG